MPHWLNAYPISCASATLKLLNGNLIVTELSPQLPSGEGEHIRLDIEKNGGNTAFVGQNLADAAGVQERDVGYAGLKDRHAIPRQWFSIYHSEWRYVRPCRAPASGVQGALPEP